MDENPYSSPQAAEAPRSPPPPLTDARRFISLAAAIGALSVGIPVLGVSLAVWINDSRPIGHKPTLLGMMAPGLFVMAIGGAIGIVAALGILAVRYVRWWAHGRAPAAQPTQL
jgi:hypothetical protein